MKEYSWWGVEQASAHCRRVGDRAPGWIAAEREYGGASYIVARANYQRRGSRRSTGSVRMRSATRDRKRSGNNRDECNGWLGLHTV